MKPLYQLVAAHKRLQELDPEEVGEQCLMDTLAGLEGDITTKATSIAGYIRNAECFAEAVEDAAKKMKARANRLYDQAERVKSYLLKQMQELGETRIETPQFIIKISKNPPSVIIDDENKIPDKYKYIIPEDTGIDKAAIKADLENGDVVPGARLHQGVRISIKE